MVCNEPAIVSRFHRRAGVFIGDRFPNRVAFVSNHSPSAACGCENALRDAKLTVVLAVSGDDARVRHAAAFLARRPDYAYVVVTHDDARALERTLGAAEGVDVVAIDADLGHAAAMRAGSLRATTAFVAFADVGYDLREVDLDRALVVLERGDAAAVTFPRAEVDRSDPQLRAAAACRRLYRGFVRSLLGVEMRDAYAPVKVFRRDALVRVFEHLRYASRAFDAELFFWLRRIGAAPPVELAVRCERHAPYRFELVPGLVAALSVLGLWAFARASRRFGVLELLTRRFEIPAKPAYEIVVFSWRCPFHPSAGGGEVYLHEQARCWVAAGHRVTWVAQSVRGRPPEEIVDGIRIVRPAPFPFVFAAAGWWYLTKSGRSADFLLDCMNGIPFFTPLFSVKPKACLVHHIHSEHFREELPPLLAQLAVFVETKLVPFVYRRTPFVTVSESTRGELARLGIARRPASVVHNGVDASYVPGRRAAVPTVLYLGRLRRYKRVRTLIDAFARADVPGARLIVAGDGDDRGALERHVAERGIAGVEFLGFVSDARKRELLQEAWVLGMPSSKEGWGIVVIEANACATPALAFRVHGLRDCVVDGETGVLIADGDAAAYARALRRLLLDRGERERLAANALVWAGQFSWSRTAERLIREIKLLQPWRAVFGRDPERGWELLVRQVAADRPLTVTSSRPPAPRPARSPQPSSHRGAAGS